MEQVKTFLIFLVFMIILLSAGYFAYQYRNEKEMGVLPKDEELCEEGETLKYDKTGNPYCEVLAL